MNQESENALRLLTGKTSLSETSPDELQQLADAHPYFAAAQLLLAQKMKQTGSANLPAQLQKTALYFPNEQWLCYLLSETKKEATPAIEINNKTVAEPLVKPTATEAGAEQTPSEIAAASGDESSHGFHRNTDPERVMDAKLPEATATEPVTEQQDNKTEDGTQSSAEDTNLITLPAEQMLEEIPATVNIDDEPEEAPLDDEELQAQSEELPLAQTTQKISSLLSGQAEDFHKPVAEDAQLPIAAPEPLHTVDYFASQGIRLDPKREENTFDKKVHKFTDWLRQMKRISPQPADLGTETEEEQYVANIADSSNHTKKVLTESMAEVLLKQGKRDKAIEIYQKLSLLNPGKSIYFAALIQNIK